MTVTVNLPQTVEQAYITAARAKGVSIDALVSDVLLSHLPVPESLQPPVHFEPQFVEEHGITVLKTGSLPAPDTD